MFWSRIREIHKSRHFYLFVSPFFILFAVFGFYPLVFSLYMSFVQWDGLTELQWVGLKNYQLMFFDRVFFESLWNTLVIGALYIPAMIFLAFLLANALNSSWLRFRGFFRAAFFLPAVTPMVAIAVVFGLLYGIDSGLLNHLLSKVGVEAVPWLNSKTYSKPAIALLVLWRWTGYNMIIMLAGLQGIDPTYYEAAKVDGANAWQRMTRITVPLMKPIFVFVLITSIIGTAYMFDEVFVLTQGGPGISTTTFGLYLFDTSFQNFRFGYASAMAYTMAFIVFVITMVILKRKWTD